MANNELPAHLGGHMNKVHVDRGSLLYMKETFDCKDMIDVGCGPGWQVQLATDLGYECTIGIDGDWTVLRSIQSNSKNPFFYIHDFTAGPWLPFELPFIPDRFDLAWCVEFLEHIEEQYLPNVFETFKTCRYVVMTHAVPGQDGHHHVNCQTADYWIAKFEENGFRYLPVTTKKIREASTMQKPFIQRTGMVFQNLNDKESEDE